MVTLAYTRAVVVEFFPCRHVAKVKICCRQNCRLKLLTNWSQKSSIRDAKHTTIATVLLQFIAVRQYAAI